MKLVGDCIKYTGNLVSSVEVTIQSRADILQYFVRGSLTNDIEQLLGMVIELPKMREISEDHLNCVRPNRCENLLHFTPKPIIEYPVRIRPFGKQLDSGQHQLVNKNVSVAVVVRNCNGRRFANGRQIVNFIGSGKKPLDQYEVQIVVR